MAEEKNKKPEELNDEQLDEVSGGGENVHLDLGGLYRSALELPDPRNDGPRPLVLSSVS